LSENNFYAKFGFYLVMIVILEDQNSTKT